MAKQKRSKKPNTFATMIGVVTIVLIVGFLVQSSIMIFKDNPIAKVFSPEETTALEREKRRD